MYVHGPTQRLDMTDAAATEGRLTCLRMAMTVTASP